MNINKSIIRGTLAGVGVIALAAGGGTFASWSDFDVIADNGAGAGIMRLDVSNRHGSTVDVAPFRLAPGQNKAQEFYLASADATNVPAGTLTATILNLRDIEDNGPACTTNSEALAEAPDNFDSHGLPTNPLNDCGATGELSGQLKTQILFSAPVASAASCPNTGIYGGPLSKTLAQQVAGGPWTLGTLTAGQGICVRVEMSLPATATNAVQGDDVAFDYRFDLVQN